MDATGCAAKSISRRGKPCRRRASFRRTHESLWEVVFHAMAMGLCILLPGTKLVTQIIDKRALPEDPWSYALVGIGAFLVLIYEYLKKIWSELRTMTNLVYTVLKDTDSDEAAISLSTYHHLHRLLGLKDSEC
jgi:tryptophan 2,3-dioxygenase